MRRYGVLVAGSPVRTSLPCHRCQYRSACCQERIKVEALGLSRARKQAFIPHSIVQTPAHCERYTGKACALR